MVKSSKPEVKKRKATVRKKKPKPDLNVEITFKFKESEVKRLGGLTKLCDFVYGCIEATSVGLKN